MDSTFSALAGLYAGGHVVNAFSAAADLYAGHMLLNHEEFLGRVVRRTLLMWGCPQRRHCPEG